MQGNFFDFVGGSVGKWNVTSIQTLIGDTLEPVTHLSVLASDVTQQTHNGLWRIKAFTSNVRYAEKTERVKLAAVQAELGRSNSTCAAFIPIRKTEAWWALAQDDRRKIFEVQSHHTEIGLNYLPAIARKLYHCRDIGQPFHFVTWFEYAPADEPLFDKLLAALRTTEEWKYVDREIDMRLVLNQNSQR
jgi:chlorite dismutase